MQRSFFYSIVAVAGLVAFALSGCATQVRDPKSGVTVFSTHGDAANLTYTGPGYSLHADKLIHSVPTRAAFDGVAKTATAAGAGVAASGFLRPGL